MAALRAGETTAIVNAARLRIKESDRLSAMAAALTAAMPDARELILRRLAENGVTVVTMK